MSDKTTFTNPKKPGASQETVFINTGYDAVNTSSPGSERDRAKVTTKSASRGEKRFSELPTAR